MLVDGKIQQHATPQEIYERPANLTVAQFMGVNVLPAKVLAECGVRIKDDSQRLESLIHGREESTYMTIPPEQTWIAENHSGMTNLVPVRLVKAQYRGGEYRLQVRLVVDERQIAMVEARSKKPPVGESLFIHLPVDAIHVIQEYLTAGVPPPAAQASPIQQLTILKEEIA